MSRRTREFVTVNDRMQTNYAYALTVPEGRDFDPEFLLELTPKKMLALGVFGRKRASRKTAGARAEPRVERGCTANVTCRRNRATPATLMHRR
jgi:hypothetical protein